MIIETSDNRFYRVWETDKPDLAHCWHGVRVKKVRGQWDIVTERKTAGGRRVNRSFPELVRKAATRVVEA